METTETTRTRRDAAIIAALADRAINDPFGGEDNDGFSVKVLESGLIAVGFSTHMIHGATHLSGRWAWVKSFANMTKLDSGESIAYTDEGRAFLAAYEVNH